MNPIQPTALRSLLLAAGCASLLATVPARAQQAPQAPPASAATAEQRQPEQPQPDQARGGGGERREADGERRGPRYGEGRQADGAPPPSPDGGGEPVDRPPPPQGDLEEWERAMTFMKEHSPKRWALLPEMPEYFQQGVRERMFGRYRQLERWRNSDKEMYDIGMRRLALEDELWTTRMIVRMKGQALTAEEVSQLREKVAAFVDLALEERELRIQRLRDILKREEAIFGSERAQRDTMVSENAAMLERGERSSLFGGAGGGGFGGFSPGGGGGGGGRMGPGPGGPSGGPGAGGPGSAPPPQR